MPNTASAKKRLRQNEVLRVHNRAVKSSVKTQLKKVRSAITANDIATAESEFRIACKKLDRAASRNVIHKNAVARTKSRLSKAIKAAKAG